MSPYDGRKAFTRWAKSVRNKSSRHITELGFMSRSGKVMVSNNHACHAGLRGSYGWYFIEEDGRDLNKRLGKYCLKADPLVAIYTAIVNDETPKDQQLPFVDYLINRSPWVDCFLDKDAKDVVDSGCWTLDPSQPSNYIAGACMATRWITEWPDRCKAWIAMVESGVDENEAMFLSHGMKALGEWGELFPIILDTSSAWHTPLDKDFSSASFSNFLKGEGRKDKPYFERLSYGSVHSTWGEGRGLDYTDFTNIKPRGEAKKSVGKVNLDIFWKPKKQKDYEAKYKYTSHVQLKHLVEDIKEIIYA